MHTYTHIQKYTRLHLLSHSTCVKSTTNTIPASLHALIPETSYQGFLHSPKWHCHTHAVDSWHIVLRPYFRATVSAHAPEEEVPPLFSFFLSFFLFLTLLLYMGCLRDIFISSHLCRNGAYHSAHDCAHSTNAIPPLRSVWVAATSWSQASREHTHMLA